MPISVITCTNSRPVGIELLERHLLQQRHREFYWWIISDGDSQQQFPSCANVITRQGDIYISHDDKQTFPVIGPHSMLNNLYAGLCAAEGNIIIAEDDEYYQADYVGQTVANLFNQDVIGYCPSHYYNLRTRSYLNFHNQDFATLAATAWQAPITHYVKEMIKESNISLDLMIWEREIYEGCRKKLIFNQTYSASGNVPLNISFKGLPGQAGYGRTHNQLDTGNDWSFEHLTKLMGREQVRPYACLAGKMVNGEY